MRMKKHMNVIRHDHKTIQIITATVEMKQGSRNDFTVILLSQKAFAMGIIEQLFKTQSEFTIVFTEVFVAPWFGMIF